MVGNNATAAVLLLYYHMATCGGFTNDETVYIDQSIFDGKRFVDVVVEEDQKNEIDQEFLRQGAIIFLLCDLNDIIDQCEDWYLSHEETKEILSLYDQGKMSAIPEVSELISLLKVPEIELDYESYSEILSIIYEKYVLGAFARLQTGVQP